MSHANERKVLLATSLGHLLSHFIMLVFPAVVTLLMEEFGASRAEVFRCSLPAYLLYGLGALPAGLLTDRWGGRPLLAACLAGAGLGALGAAVAGSLLQLTLALAVVGASASIYHPAGMTLISRTIAASGRALGINGVFGNLGIAAAPFVSGALAALWSWRFAFAASGVALLASALLVLWVRPEDAHGPCGLEGAPAKSWRRAPLAVYILFALGMMGAGLGYRASSLTFPSFFEARVAVWEPLFASLAKEGGAATLAATFVTSLAYAFGMLGQLFGGRIADRADLRVAYAAFHLAAAPFALALAWLPELLLPLAAAGYVAFAMGMQPIENSLVAQLSTRRTRGLFYGLKFSLSFGVGALAVQAAAWLEATRGLPAVFVFTASATLTTALAAGAMLLASRGEQGFARRPGTAAEVAESKGESPPAPAFDAVGSA